MPEPQKPSTPCVPEATKQHAPRAVRPEARDVEEERRAVRTGQRVGDARRSRRRPLRQRARNSARAAA